MNCVRGQNFFAGEICYVINGCILLRRFQNSSLDEGTVLIEEPSRKFIKTNGRPSQKAKQDRDHEGRAREELSSRLMFPDNFPST